MQFAKLLLKHTADTELAKQQLERAVRCRRACDSSKNPSNPRRVLTIVGCCQGQQSARVHGQPQLKAEVWCLLAQCASWECQYTVAEQLYKKALAFNTAELSEDERCVTVMLRILLLRTHRLLADGEPGEVAVSG